MFLVGTEMNLAFFKSIFTNNKDILSAFEQYLDILKHVWPNF